MEKLGQEIINYTHILLLFVGFFLETESHSLDQTHMEPTLYVAQASLKCSREFLASVP